MTAGVEKQPWHVGGVEERPWRELGRQEATAWLQGAGAGGEEQRMLAAAAAAARKKALLARDGESVLQREGCWWAVVGP